MPDHRRVRRPADRKSCLAVILRQLSPLASPTLFNVETRGLADRTEMLTRPACKGTAPGSLALSARSGLHGPYHASLSCELKDDSASSRFQAFRSL